MTTSRSPSPPHGYGYRGGQGYANGHANGFVASGNRGKVRYPDHYYINGAGGGTSVQYADRPLYRESSYSDGGYSNEMTESDLARFRSGFEPEMTEAPLILDGGRDAPNHILTGEPNSPPFLLAEDGEEMLKYTIYEQRSPGQRNVIGTLTTVRGRCFCF